MDDLFSLAEQILNLKPPCEHCGLLYLVGSETACATCLRRSHDPDKKHRRNRLKCDCSRIAVAVVYVKIKFGGIINQEPMPLCEDCLRIEIDTAANYLRRYRNESAPRA